jgi:four helix bundle protein
MKDHKDLEVWQRSMDMVVYVYQLTAGFPKEEIYGLTSQLRRAAVSVPSNISEGAARNSTKEFVQFLHIALGSATEIETQLILAGRLKLCDDAATLLEQVTIVKKLISGLIRHYKLREQ